MKRLSKVNTTWSSSLAYTIGIIATDGNLSPNGRSINITSKDISIIQNVKSSLSLSNKIGRKANGSSVEKKYFVLQFGDINFYEFLNKIGLFKNKSKSIGILDIPKEFFFDFLRGCIDGDGNIDVFLHNESNLPQLKLRLCSASLSFLNWIMDEISIQTKITTGGIYSNKHGNMHILSYGKNDAGKIFKLMYYNDVGYYLDRKYQIAKPFIA